MATWMVHFRIADKIIEHIPDINSESFLVGSIGPDCGEANEDWSVFSPSSEITHWSPGGKKENCNYELFYDLILNPQKLVVNELSKLNKYQCGCKSHCNTNGSSTLESDNTLSFKDNFIIENKKLSFYIGYYIHLLTDVLWVAKIAKSTREKWNDNFQTDHNFIWEVKKDWYDLDHLYLKKYPDFRAFHIFKEIENFDNIYLDYYSKEAFNKQIKYISEFYSQEYDNLEREYIYLTEVEMDNFVQEAYDMIINDLKSKKII